MIKELTFKPSEKVFNDILNDNFRILASYEILKPTKEASFEFCTGAEITILGSDGFKLFGKITHEFAVETVLLFQFRLYPVMEREGEIYQVLDADPSFARTTQDKLKDGGNRMFDKPVNIPIFLNVDKRPFQAELEIGGLQVTDGNLNFLHVTFRMASHNGFQGETKAVLLQAISMPNLAKHLVM